MQYIVFFDDRCGLCERSVVFFLKRDTKKQFLFAPLSGKTATVELKEWLKSHSAVDSIVLVEKRDDGSKLRAKLDLPARPSSGSVVA